MPASNFNHLSEAFRKTVAKAAARLPKKLSLPPPPPPSTTIADDAALKQHVSLLVASSSTPTPEATVMTKTAESGVGEANKLKGSKRERVVNEDSISCLLLRSLNPSTETNSKERSVEKQLDLPWLSNLLNIDAFHRRKELSRERKQKWIYKNTQNVRFSWLVRKCAKKLGVDAAIQVFGKLRPGTGRKEYNTLIRLYIDTARKAEDEEVALDQSYRAYQLFKLMKEEGFNIEEETYGPFLIYLIDMHMTDEFYFFLPLIKDENASSMAMLGYYEMLLLIEVGDEDKIHELISKLTHEKCEHDPNLQALAENYLLALGERDRKKEFLQLLQVIDITNLPLDNIGRIFKSLGRLSLQSFAEDLILAFKTNDQEFEILSDFIYLYSTSVTNLSVEDAILKYKDMHAKLEVLPSSKSYEELIKFCCGSLKVHLALDVADQLCQAGLSLSTETLNTISRACEESSEFYLVRQIYSIICCHNLSPNSETFRSMINSSVRMKDFDGAYDMLKVSEKKNLMPSASMYNAIMGGYFREGNTVSGFEVLKQMEKANVKPDCITYSYLIGNSKCVDDIIKYFEEMKTSSVTLTKHVFMAMINAYVTCGELEKAKQVVFDKAVPEKNANEIRSALLSALASNGKISDALDIYEEIKQSGSSVEPKALISLLEHIQVEGELPRLLQFLEELSDPDYWADGCFRVISYCIRHKDIQSAVDLLKKLKDAFDDDELAGEVLFDGVFCQIAEMEPSGLQIGLELLQSIKEDLKLLPSRKCLDFLLSACVKAKDVRSSLMIWKEYQMAGLPYNLLTFLRMYQALLTSGDFKSAAKMQDKLRKNEHHIHSIVVACEDAFSKPTEKNKDTARKKKKF